MSLIAFHGEKSLKSRVLEEVTQAKKDGMLAQGWDYWKDGKGCAVGCLLKAEDGDYFRYESELGIPVELAHIEDNIFECLPAKKAQTFPRRFFDAIPLGADLSGVSQEYFRYSRKFMKMEPNILQLRDILFELLKASPVSESDE